MDPALVWRRLPYFQHQRIAFWPEDRLFPKLGLAKLPASGASEGKGRGLAGRANCLSSSAYFKRVAHESIESPRSDRIGQADIGLVAQDDHAHVPVKLKADIRTKTGL
jgi:hypothetical protein